MPVSNGDFVAACAAGDLDIVRAYVWQEEVRNEIVETDAFIAAKAPPTIRFQRRSDTHGPTCHPWYICQLRRGLNELFVFAMANRFEHFHIVEWFYGSDQASFMETTLKFLFSDVLAAATRGRSAAPLIDYLLNTATFKSFPNPQRVLNDAFVACLEAKSSLTHAEVLISHGANTDEFESLFRVNRCDDEAICPTLGGLICLPPATAEMSTRHCTTQFKADP